MRTKIVNLGDGLGLPIPWAIAEKAGLSEGSVVDLGIEGNQLVVGLAPSDSVTLEDLLGGISEGNIHGRISTGDARGGEIW